MSKRSLCWLPDRWVFKVGSTKIELKEPEKYSFKKKLENLLNQGCQTYWKL